MAQFPYNESFKGKSAVGVKYGGNTGAFLTAGLTLDNNIKDPENEGYLRLTSNQKNQTGYVYADAIFLGTYGLDIEFEYFTYGGTGDADGLCFFLFDATASPFNIGGFGGSLGYAQYLKDGLTLPGVSKGYLGIGIDEYGNFATNADNRQGGYTSVRTSSVTIRGAGNGDAITAENYKWLKTVETKTLQLAEDRFSIRGNKRGAVAGEDAYRKVFIKLTPIAGAAGLKVNLSIQHGSTITPVIRDYEYTTAIPVAGLRYGIAASTGDLTNYHEIRGLKIAVDPDKLAVPLAQDDEANVCQAQNAEVDILSNDNSPNDVNRLNERVDLNPLTENFETTFTNDQGTFTFDETKKVLRFTPVHGLSDNTSITYRYMDYFGAISNVAKVKINVILPKITKSPQNVTVCEGQSASLTAEAVAGSDISYQWQHYNETSAAWENLTDVNGISGTTSSTIHFENAALANSGKYLVNIQSSANACGAVSSDAAILTVRPAAIVNQIASQEICSGSSTLPINFDFSGGNTYHWTNDNTAIGLPPSGDANIAGYIPVNNTNQNIVAHITVTPTSSAGCTVTPVVFNITVFPAVVKPEITAVELSFCQGKGVAIVSSYKEGNQWYKNGLLIEDATEEVYDVNSAGSYTVMHTDKNGCSALSDAKTITMYPRPSRPSITGDLNFCKGKSVTLTSTPGLKYRWYLGGELINGADGLPYDAQTYTTAVAGNYTVATLNENGCFSISSNAHNLVENPLPAVPVITSASASFCQGEGLSLTSSPAFAYQWYKDGTAVPGAVSQVYVATEPAEYSVVVFNESGCSSDPAFKEITFTAIPTLFLTSATGTDLQELCLDQAIIPIVYQVANAAGASVAVLPQGLHSAYNATTKQLTITGTPTESGIFTYSVTTEGGCGTKLLSGTIKVNPDATLSLTSAIRLTDQKVCIHNGIEPILYQAEYITAITVTGLPDGVEGKYKDGVLTISGTPAVSGVFDYSVSTVGGCTVKMLNGTITVTPGATLGLASAAASTTQVVCINTAIQPVLYTAANTITVKLTGTLPNGVTGAYYNGIFTISGTPAESGVFNYAVTTEGGCGTKILSGMLTVSPEVTLTLNSASKDSEVCINTEIEPVSYATTATGITVTGLPAGMKGEYAEGILTISGTPTVSGVFTYTVSTIGGCTVKVLQGTITVTPEVTLVLTSAVTATAQIVCINTAIEPIVYTADHAATVKLTGHMPGGIDWGYNNGIFTISGTPTESGEFTYSVTTEGGCGAKLLSGTLKVNPEVTLVLTSTEVSAGQAVCINTSIEPILYQAEYANDVKVTGLPAGVKGEYTNGVLTISGTPTASGVFDYTVTTIGGCTVKELKGRLTVSPDVTLIQTSSPATSGQSVCVNTAIEPIIYQSAFAADITVTGLPDGLAGIFKDGVFTVSGSPAAAGTFTYKVTAKGLCLSAEAQGTVTVQPDVAIVLTSGTAATAVCVNMPVQNIIYTITNGEATVTGLPEGVKGEYKEGIFTISGVPAAIGEFDYKITATGSCLPAFAEGKITVKQNTSITLSTGNTNPATCINTALTDISYTITNGTDATVTGLPAGLKGEYADGIFTISGVPSISGDFTYTVTATGSCTPAIIQGTITVNPPPAGVNDVYSRLSCEQNELHYNLQDNVNNTTYGGNAVPSVFSWTVTPNSFVGGLADGSGNTISGILTNTSQQVQQAVYTVTPTSVSGCPGNPFTLTVNVPVCSAITLTKTADRSSVSAAGDQIQYNITVTNTALANHTNVQVTDPYLGGLLTSPTGDNGNGILEAGEAWVYQGTYVVTAADIDHFGKPNNGSGLIVNTASLTTAEHPDPLTAEAIVTFEARGIVRLVKTGVVSDDFNKVTYTFKITNTGNLPLKELSLADVKITDNITLPATTLGIGDSILVTADYLITDQEKKDGQVINTATVSGQTDAGRSVSDISGTAEDNDDPTVLNINDAPYAVDDISDTKVNNPMVINLSANDLPSFNGLDAGSIVITRLPLHGTVVVNTDGTVVYTPANRYSGDDDFTYTIKDLKGKVSNVATVKINTVPIDLFIPNTFTPNGDGKNDTFQILGMEVIDSADLLVFNRWGNEVYHNKNYHNEWDGSGLAEGTYYYNIVFKKGTERFTKKGWLLLKR